MLRTSKYYDTVESAIRAGLGHYALGDAEITVIDNKKKDNELFVTIAYDKKEASFTMNAPRTIYDIPESISIGAAGEKNLGVKTYHLKIDNLDATAPDVFTIKATSLKRAGVLVAKELFDSNDFVSIDGTTYAPNEASEITELVRRAEFEEIPRKKASSEAIGVAVNYGSEYFISANAEEEGIEVDWEWLSENSLIIEKAILDSLIKQYPGWSYLDQGHDSEDLIASVFLDEDVPEETLQYIIEHSREYGESDIEIYVEYPDTLKDHESTLALFLPQVYFFDLPNEDDSIPLWNKAILKYGALSDLLKTAGFNGKGTPIGNTYLNEYKPTFGILDTVTPKNVLEAHSVIAQFIDEDEVDQEFAKTVESARNEIITNEVCASFKTAGVEDIEASIHRGEWKSDAFDGVIEIKSNKRKSRFSVKASFTNGELTKLAFQAQAAVSACNIRTYRVDLSEAGSFRVSAVSPEFAVKRAFESILDSLDEPLFYNDDEVTPGTMDDVAEKVVSDGRVYELTQAAMETDPVRNGEDTFGSPWTVVVNNDGSSELQFIGE